MREEEKKTEKKKKWRWHVIPSRVFFSSPSFVRFARRLGLQAKLYNFRTTVKDIEDVQDPSDLANEPLIILLAATYLNGKEN